MSDDGLFTAKCRLLEIFANYDNTELENIEKWISSQAYKKGEVITGYIILFLYFY